MQFENHFGGYYVILFVLQQAGMKMLLRLRVIWHRFTICCFGLVKRIHVCIPKNEWNKAAISIAAK
jgi:hypothetical protein